jgi:hypothetical protein
VLESETHEPHLVEQLCGERVSEFERRLSAVEESPVPLGEAQGSMVVKIEKKWEIIRAALKNPLIN